MRSWLAATRKAQMRGYALGASSQGLFATDATVRRYESSFVKRELKFAPFVRLASR